MPARDLECQIAKTQIGWYLAGEGLAPDALAQLEQHIAECDSCKGLLTERRKSLQAMLGWQSNDVTAIPIDGTGLFTHTPRPAPTSAQTKQRLPMPKRRWEPIALAGGLALVLIGMSYVEGDSGGILGGRAADALPGEPSGPTTNKQLSNQPVATNEAHRDPFTPPAVRSSGGRTETVIVSAELPEPAEVVAAPVSTPYKTTTAVQTTTAKPKPRIKPKANSAPAPTLAIKPPPAKATAHTEAIRVYDENGNPIK